MVEFTSKPAASNEAKAEEGVTATRELCHTVKAQENMEFGAGVAGSSASMMVAWYFLSPEARGAHNLRYVIPMLLGFTCFISGLCQMLLNMNLLELPEHLVSEVQCMASKCLSLLCSTLPVVTLLSPLVLSGYKVYRYIGLTLLIVVTAPLAVLRWYTGRKAEGGNEEAAYEEHKEQLEAAFKFISAMSNSASGGLVALMVNYSVTGGSGRTKSEVLVAIFIFTTAMWGLLSMEIRTKELSNNYARTPAVQGVEQVVVGVTFKIYSDGRSRGCGAGGESGGLGGDEEDGVVETSFIFSAVAPRVWTLLVVVTRFTMGFVSS